MGPRALAARVRSTVDCEAGTVSPCSVGAPGRAGPLDAPNGGPAARARGSRHLTRPRAREPELRGQEVSIQPHRHVHPVRVTPAEPETLDEVDDRILPPPQREDGRLESLQRRERPPPPGPPPPSRARAARRGRRSDPPAAAAGGWSARTPPASRMPPSPPASRCALRGRGPPPRARH